MTAKEEKAKGVTEEDSNGREQSMHGQIVDKNFLLFHLIVIGKH